MIGQHFYNETLKTAVAVFGSLFNNIVIKNGSHSLPVTHAREIVTALNISN